MRLLRLVLFMVLLVLVFLAACEITEVHYVHCQPGDTITLPVDVPSDSTIVCPEP